MKKFLITILSLTVFLLVGCGVRTTQAPGTTKTKETQKPRTTSENDKFWDQDENGIPDWQEKEINLTYATWQYNDDTVVIIDSLMIEAFMEKYPNIHVTMLPIGEYYEWDANLQAKAEVGELPDVFLVNRLETALPYKLLADITEYYNHDDDTKFIFESVQHSGMYDGKRYAIPTFIYPYYFFVNLDILTNNGISAPSYDWSWDQMEAIAQACYNESEHIVGQYGTISYKRELPKILSGNPSWCATTFDGEKFNFDSPYFEAAFEKLTNALKTHAVTRTYDEETLTTYYGNPTYQPNYDGSAAIWCDPSWTAKDYFEKMSFNWDVYPAPGGSTCANTDIAGVSSTCANKDAAYQLLKWLSYSEEGLITRFELYEDYSDILFKSANNYPYPIVDYGIDKHGVNKIWDNIPYNNVPGMTSPQMINSLKNAALLSNKETVGWDTVENSVGEYFTMIMDGTDTFANLKETIVNVAKQAYDEYIEAFNELIK